MHVLRHPASGVSKSRAGWSTAVNAIADNPLFGHDRLPAFDRVRAEHVEPAIRERFLTWRIFIPVA